MGTLETILLIVIAVVAVAVVAVAWKGEKAQHDIDLHNARSRALSLSYALRKG